MRIRIAPECLPTEGVLTRRNSTYLYRKYYVSNFRNIFGVPC
jgi:hypothetical protein